MLPKCLYKITTITHYSLHMIAIEKAVPVGGGQMEDAILISSSISPHLRFHSSLLLAHYSSNHAVEENAKIIIWQPTFRSVGDIRR